MADRESKLESEESKNGIILKVLCNTCLCVGRNVKNITHNELRACYLDILREIPLSNNINVKLTICWECESMLKKIIAFREQVKDSYRILQTYSDDTLHEYLFSDVSRPPRLEIHKNISINIEPSEEKQIVADNFSFEDHKENEIINAGNQSDNCLLSNSHSDSDVETLLEMITKKKKNKTKKTKKIKKKHNAKCVPYQDIKTEYERDVQTTVISDLHLDVTNTDSEVDTLMEKVKKDKRKRIVKIKDKKYRGKKGNTDSIVNETQFTSLPDIKLEFENKELRNDETSDNIHEITNVDSDVETLMKMVAKEEKKSKKKKGKTSKEERKRSKSDKIITIELTYDEMLLEREQEATKYSYMKAEYKCQSCLIAFGYRKTYKQHMAKKHTPGLGDYICPICKTILNSVSAFTAHYKRHMRRYECHVCQKRTNDMKVMQQHYYCAHGVSLRTYTCAQCGHTSNSIDAHRYHLDTHKARVQCTECDKTFSHRAGLMNHRLAVHELHNQFPCTVCKKVFRWKTSLKRHVLTHKPSKEAPCLLTSPYCDACDISFASICSYQRHMKNSLKHVTQDQLKYICEHCNSRFADKTKIRDHIEEKHLFKTYQCHICLKWSKNRVGLDQHIRNVHKGRPNNKICHHCGKGFPTKVQLESHIRSHTGERPFICEYCPATFSQQSNLYKHNRQVHLNIKSKRYPVCKKRKEDNQITPAIAPPTVAEYTQTDIHYAQNNGYVI